LKVSCCLKTESVNEEGFSASWKVLSFNRPFSQKWLDSEQSLSGSEFGVRLLIPADQYQKSIRTAKYGGAGYYLSLYCFVFG
jgi:inner membrane protein